MGRLIAAALVLLINLSPVPLFFFLVFPPITPHPPGTPGTGAQLARYESLHVIEVPTRKFWNPHFLLKNLLEHH